MNKTTSARQAAVQALMSHRKSGLSAELALDNQINNKNLDPRDAALAMRLTFGVLQNRTLLDFYLSRFSHTPIEKLEPRILDILRVAAYQICFLDRIPIRAAVDEAVTQTKSGSPKAAGLVNAVLRRFSEARDALPEPSRDDLATYLSIQYSHPRWLVQRFLDELGPDGTEALLAANNAEVPLYAQVNTLKTTTPAVEEALTAEGVTTAHHPWLPDCLILTGVGNPAKLKPFQDGQFYIQDPAAKLAVLTADPKPGTKLLDPCAAPGGKSFAAAIQMGNKGEILASDLQEKKLPKIKEGAARLGIDIIQFPSTGGVPEGRGGPDAKDLDPNELGLFDTVLVDAPCSGLGIIRKKPEIRDKSIEEISRLPEIQFAILEGAARCVAPGGTLLYATCTILPEENSGVVSAFLETTTDFIREAFTLPGNLGPVPNGEITLYPHIHSTDGFFFSKLRRVK